MFRTQWFIGQYCSERQGRGYRCRCTSVPVSLSFISILWLYSKHDRKGDGFFRFQTIIGAQVRFLKRFSSLSLLLSVYGLAFFFYFSYSYNAFPHFFSTFTIWPCITSLPHCPTGHECHRFPCQNRIKNVITACELSVTRLPHERYLLHRWYEKNFSSGLLPRWSGGALSAIIESNVVHQLSYGVNHSISMV